MKSISGVIFLLCIVWFPVMSQPKHKLASQIKIDNFYDATFLEVIKQIGKEHGVVFQYATDKLARVKVTDRPFNQALNVFLDAWCKKYKLNWYQDDAFVIHILDRDQSQNVTVFQKKTLTAFFGPPQNFNILIKGQIKDALSGESLPSATIQVKGTTIGAATNVDGFFMLNHVPTDTSSLLITYIGYEPLVLKLNPEAAKKDILVEIEPSSSQLQEVVVTADQISTIKANETISAVKLSPQSLYKMPNVGERDIMRSFQLMPGVSASNESSSGLYVRGGTPDQNLILYDGFTIYHVDHLYGFFSAFNANALKDVQLYKGGFESKFGGRLSSVMEVTGKDGNAKGFNVGGDLSLLSANAFFEIPFGRKVTSIFALRRSWRGPLYNKIFDSFNESNQTVPGPGSGGPRGPGGRGGPDFATQIKSYFYDLNSKITYKPTERDIISLSVFNGTDKLDNGQKLETPSFLANQGIRFGFDINDLTRYGNFGSSLKWARQWTNKFYHNALVSYSNYYSERDRSNGGTITRDGEEQTFKSGTLENNNLKDFSFKTDFTYEQSDKRQWTIGAFGTHYDIAYTFSQNDTATILDRQTKGNLIGGYTQAKILTAKKLQILPGLRLSYFDMTGKVYTEPRLSVQYNLNNNFNLNGAVGRYYQFANRITREDILSGSRDFWVLSDGNTIPVSHSDHFIAGINHDTRQYLFSVEMYRKNFSNLSEYSLRFEPSIRGITYNENFFTGNGYAQGIEFLAQKKLGSLTGWAGYTLMRARNQFDIYGEKQFSSAQDVTHEFKTVTIYNRDRWNFSASLIYATGRPYTAPAGGYQLTLLDGSQKDFISIGSKNGQRLPDYSRLDLAATYDLQNIQGNPIGSIGLSIFNVYNRKNVWYKEFQMVSGQVVESDIRYLGITPNLIISLRLH
jgi:ferric enterobactin receptor